MKEIQIEKIKEILLKYFGQEWAIDNITVKPLLPEGEGVCSNILDVSATLSKLSGSKEIKVLRAVSKCPISKGLFATINSQMYRREVSFYTKIIPSLKEFGHRHCNLEIENFFPKFYGCSDEPDKANADFVLMIEDLGTKGYGSLDKCEGYDYDQIKHVLKNVALLHGTSLAMKVKEPGTFSACIKTFCEMELVPDEFVDELWKFLPDFKQNEENIAKLLLQILEEHRMPQQYIRKMSDYFQKEKFSLAGLKLHTAPGSEPFNTLIHNDLWINNIMHIMKDGNISEMKLIDFQMYRYNHPAKDLMHLLFTSVKYDVLKQHLDDLIDFYYDNLMSALLEMNCDISRFEKRQFLKDITVSIGAIFGHIIYMVVFVIFGKRSNSETIEERLKDIPDEAKQKFCFLVEQVFERGWYKGIREIERILGDKAYYVCNKSD
ncbi:unnamed protein product [Acanthoscelides obtectus]|uniref:CHK kinase-like domain-containing protein n=1 Tax=Acanthoscelides obtectus TaxID=200917 RepID=A0A9P0M9Y6_ACAOB|nr:unnamed protein product [Acanthoscelides obtectus]CAK1638475.1 hypothetical protein AOBTE_LOCUS10625 [Acanthoscelides obtectus]